MGVKSGSCGYLEGVLWVSGGCLVGDWRVSCGCLEGVLWVSGGCFLGLWTMSGGCKKRILRVYWVSQHHGFTV